MCVCVCVHVGERESLMESLCVIHGEKTDSTCMSVSHWVDVMRVVCV